VRRIVFIALTPSQRLVVGCDLKRLAFGNGLYK